MSPEPETERRPLFGGLLALLLAALQVLNPARVRAAPTEDNASEVAELEPEAGSPAGEEPGAVDRTETDAVSAPVSDAQDEKARGFGDLLMRALGALRRRWSRKGPEEPGVEAALPVEDEAPAPVVPPTERRKPNPIDALRTSVLEARAALARIDGETEPLLARLGMDGMPTLRELEETGIRLVDQVESRERYGRVAQETGDARVAAERTATRAKEANDALVEARRNEEATEGEWSAWLEGRGFAPDLHPRAVLEALSRIAGLRALIGERRDQRARIDLMQTAIEEIETDLRGFVGAAGLPDFEGRGATPALADLAERSDRAKRATDNASRLHGESEAWAERRKSVMGDLAAARQEIEALLAKGDARDVDQFRRTAEGVEQRRELGEQLAQLQRASPYLTGIHGREVTAELRSTTHEAAESEREELQADIERLEQQRSRLDRELGEISERQQQLAGAPRTSEIQEELGQIAAKAREDAARWAVLKLADSLVDETIDQFRKERQPEQLKTASAYFQRFTSGRYATIRPRLGGGRDASAFEAVLESGQVRQVSELSRATAEQLYLALRFAIIEDFAGRNEPLPVLMDDVLVNFDPVRARAACLAIAKLSSRFQVLVMTCHPETVEWFGEAAPGPVAEGGVKVINLTA